MRIRRGFTFFEVTILLLVVVVVGMIAIPGVLMTVREQDEVRAIDLLEKVALAQHRRRHATPIASYGFLADLLAEGLLDQAGLETTRVAGGEILRLGGYYFAVFLPDESGRPVTVGERVRVDARNGGRAFLAIAWPVRAGETGYRTYAVNEDLLLWQVGDRDPPEVRAAIPDLSLSKILRPPGSPLPEPWAPLLPQITAPDMAAAVEAAGLPLPPALQTVLEQARN